MMSASKKMHAFGMKALETATGELLSNLYRWKKALDEGRGISDANKRTLIEATAGSEQAITWDDFRPADIARATDRVLAAGRSS